MPAGGQLQQRAESLSEAHHVYEQVVDICCYVGEPEGLYRHMAIITNHHHKYYSPLLTSINSSINHYERGAGAQAGGHLLQRAESLAEAHHAYEQLVNICRCVGKPERLYRHVAIITNHHHVH